MRRTAFWTMLILIGAPPLRPRAADPPGAAPPGMVRIAAGVFTMGRDGGGWDERPAHQVAVDSFFISATEVTVWEYLACVREGACRMPDWWNRRVFEDAEDERPDSDWLSLPVTGVSWNDAMDFCRWRGGGCRLPTEAEWEYACRAGTRTTYFWGDDFGQAGRFANVGRRLEPVGRHEPNAWGLYDMIGNVWEWCLDAYSGDAYRAGPASNGPTGAAPGTGRTKRVARGGSWNEYRWNLRSANRSHGEAGKGYKGLGFRVVVPAGAVGAVETVGDAGAPGSAP